MIMRGGLNVYDMPIGVLSLDSRFAKPPGHIKNGSSFSFPVVYQQVEGVTAKRIVLEPGPDLLEPFIEAVKALEQSGVRAITGSCGFLMLYQQQLADAVSIPLYTSSLIQVPMISRMLGRGRKVGIMTASRKGLTPEHLAATGISDEPICIAGMEGCREFWEVIIDNQRDDLDLDRMGEEIVSTAEQLVRDNPDVGALVLECTDMPPFAHLIQQRLGLPVFDLTTLTTMMFQVVTRRGYSGYPPAP